MSDRRWSPTGHQSSCSTPVRPERGADPATSTVTVTVTNVEYAVGYDLAGVLYKGDELLIVNVVGGFGAAVDADPFATTQVVGVPQQDLFHPKGDWPYVTDEPALLEPGTYYL